MSVELIDTAVSSFIVGCSLLGVCEFRKEDYEQHLCTWLLVYLMLYFIAYTLATLKKDDHWPRYSIFKYFFGMLNSLAWAAAMGSVVTQGMYALTEIPKFLLYVGPLIACNAHFQLLCLAKYDKFYATKDLYSDLDKLWNYLSPFAVTSCYAFHFNVNEICDYNFCWVQYFMLFAVTFLSNNICLQRIEDIYKDVLQRQIRDRYIQSQVRWALARVNTLIGEGIASIVQVPHFKKKGIENFDGIHQSFLK